MPLIFPIGNLDGQHRRYFRQSILARHFHFNLSIAAFSIRYSGTFLPAKVDRGRKKIANIFVAIVSGKTSPGIHPHGTRSTVRCEGQTALGVIRKLL